MNDDRVSIGGKVSLPAGAVNVRRASEDQDIELSLILRRPPDAPPISTPQGTPTLSREEFASQYGAAQSDIAAVQRFAAAHGLRVLQVDKPRRTITISGSASALSRAFDVGLLNFEVRGHSYRSYSGEISVPRELAETVTGVFGLDNLPAARPRA